MRGTLRASAHQSHAYTDGACLYFSLRGDVERGRRRSGTGAAWDAAAQVLISTAPRSATTHGVGLLRSPYMEEALGSGYPTLVAVKQALDPHGIMNPGKLGLPSLFGSVAH
ncbi:FAD-linked oxidase C-terminal domain-containing protein [Nonomuraea dietziae]|uniref:FAD-linked oxidase C-terminal domain-containing protein n=1 Tax=Nonomuraea dietziae TaxID=65515 RepID=UPI0031DCF697